VVVSVVAHLGQELVEFSSVAGKSEHGGGVSVHGGAGRGCRGVGGSMPCTCVC
jgi:hypothetical protein